MSDLRDGITRILDGINLRADTEEQLVQLFSDEVMAQRDGITRQVRRDLIGLSGIEQGRTRLAFIDFMSGHRGPWNGSPEAAWIRYRGHHVGRELTSDGVVVRIAYRDYNGIERSESWSAGRDGRYALVTLATIDALLDIVIEHHGVPGDEIVDAEIVETIDSATADRVLNAWERWLPTAVARGVHPLALRDEFSTAIARDEVQP